MKQCILCDDHALERKYFLKNELLCTWHYCEYLEVLIGNIKNKVTSKEIYSAFDRYKIVMEPKPLSENEKAEFLKKISEANAKARLDNKKYRSHPSSPKMGM